jgi:uncharacterized membrane protein YhaH (DUF805 family)
MHSLIEFIFPHRLHRLAYFLRGGALTILASLVYSCSDAWNPRYYWISVIALWIYALLFIDLPRIRDVRMSGWWLLVGLIPVRNVWLIANVWLAIILSFRAPSYDVDADA